MDFEQLDFNKIKTYSISERPNKVDIDAFSRIEDNLLFNNQLDSFMKLFPDILKGSELRKIVKYIKNAYRKGKPVILGMGAHVIKCGLSPLIIDLMKRHIIHGLALNGAGIIHDFELAYQGGTSEDVAAGLKDGTFGMIDETGDFIHSSIENIENGLGYSVGRDISRNNLRFKHLSLLANAYEINVPVTVHVAIGTDIIHQHPKANGKHIGDASFRDFKLFTSMVAKINDGGGFINFGSNVILPEVFLKALTIARNISPPVENFFTANFDMISHYRPNENVVRRPTQHSGIGFNFIGHHEIMLPLLYLLITQDLD